VECDELIFRTQCEEVLQGSFTGFDRGECRDSSAVFGLKSVCRAPRFSEGRDFKITRIVELFFGAFLNRDRESPQMDSASGFSSWRYNYWLYGRIFL
jgi:hypothetical protein